MHIWRKWKFGEFIRESAQRFGIPGLLLKMFAPDPLINDLINGFPSVENTSTSRGQISSHW